MKRIEKMIGQFLVNLTSAQIRQAFRRKCDKLNTGLSTENVDNPQANFKLSRCLSNGGFALPFLFTQKEQDKLVLLCGVK